MKVLWWIFINSQTALIELVIDNYVHRNNTDEIYLNFDDIFQNIDYRLEKSKVLDIVKKYYKPMGYSIVDHGNGFYIYFYKSICQLI